MLSAGWTRQWTLGAPGGEAFALAATLLLLALALWSWRRLAVLPPPARRALRALRSSGLLLGLLVVVQPERLVEVHEERAGRLAVVLDVSASMGLPDAEGGRRRIERAWEALREASGVRDDDPPEEEVELLLLDGELRAGEPLAGAEPPPATAQRSDLVGALGRWLQETQRSGEPPAAVVLLSDGADTEGGEPAALRGLGVAVHAVAVGGRRPLRDRAVLSAAAPKTVPVRDRASVRVRLRQRPFEEGERVRVTLWRGERAVSEAEVRLDGRGEGEAELPFVIRAPGHAVLRVEAEPMPGDEVPDNDVRHVLVEARREQLRVLHLAGRPSWDVRFLRAFLKRDPALQLVAFFILRTEGDETNADPDEMALIPFPTDELFRQHLDRFDVVILQNFDYEPYGIARYLPGVARHVRRGGGLVMVGGERAFERGGYGETPLGPLLPVALLPSETPARTSLLQEPFRPRVAEGMEAHPLVALWADGAGGWPGLEPVDLLHRVRRVRDGAVVPLVHPELRAPDGTPAPVLALREAGRGRVAALLTDGSWRWGMPSAARGGDPSAHARFWDRLLRWAARDPRLDPCRVRPARRRLAAGSAFDAEVQLLDEAHRPLPGDEARLLLLDERDRPVGVRSVRLDPEGRWKGRLQAPEAPGGYRLAVEAGERGCAAWLLVERAGPEMLDPAPRPELLRAVAEATGGRFFPNPSALPELRSLARMAAPLRAIRRQAPFRSWPALLILFLLLAGEWWLRRRWGLR